MHLFFPHECAGTTAGLCANQCSCHDLSHTLDHSAHVLFLLQFAVFLWVLTYVGAWFNGLTLLILGKVTESLSLHSVHSWFYYGSFFRAPDHRSDIITFSAVLFSCAAGLIGAFSSPLVYERHQVMVTAVVFLLKSCVIAETAKDNLLN